MRDSRLDAIVSSTVPAPLDEAAPRQVLLHLPVGIRSASLVLLTALACIYTLSWAKAVFVPLLLGLLASYALTPIVDRMQRWRMPRVVASAILLSTLVAALGWTGFALRDDAASLMESLPGVAQKIGATFNRPNADASVGAMDRMQQAATELERAANKNAAATGAGPARGVTRVTIEKAKFNIQDYFVTGGLGVATFIGQASAVLFLTFFLLASGSTFRRKMVKIAGPTFSQKKITIQVLDEVTEQIQRYLLVQVLMSLVVAVATWLSFLFLRVDHAAVWGLVAGMLNFVPYVGSIAFTAGSAAVGLMQFGTVESALLVAGTSLVIHTISGYILTPWLTSRASRMNAVSVFVGVLIWGWLWGLWGLLLGVPIMMVVKAVCDRVDDLKPVGELLGS